MLKYEEVKDFIEVESDSGCKLLSKEYINANTNLLIECRCGISFKATLDNFKRSNKRQCNNCGQKGKTAFTFEFAKYFIEVESNSGCKLLSKNYIDCKKELLLECECRTQFTTNFDKFKNRNKRQCNKCSKTKSSIDLRKTNTEFNKEIYDLVGDEYIVLGEYINSKTYIKICHSTCGCKWDVIPCNFLRGSRCPQCNESKGERRIRLYLESIRLKFIQELIFEDLVGVGGGNLRFDFGGYNDKDEIIYLIEYDGKQHFEHVASLMDFQSFTDIQTHDKRKNQYCKDNNIPLLRIPYWEFDNIDTIIYEWLNCQSVIHNEKIEDFI